MSPNRKHKINSPPNFLRVSIRDGQIVSFPCERMRGGCSICRKSWKHPRRNLEIEALSMVRRGIDSKLCQAGSKLILLRVFQTGRGGGRKRWFLPGRYRQSRGNASNLHRVEVSVITMYRDDSWGAFFEGWKVWGSCIEVCYVYFFDSSWRSMIICTKLVRDCKFYVLIRFNFNLIVISYDEYNNGLGLV